MQGLFLHEQNRAILQIDTVTHGNKLLITI